MKTIWKYKLSLDIEQRLEVPWGARFISAHLDPAGDLCVWAMVDKKQGKSFRTIAIVSTGHAVPEGIVKFIGTVTFETGCVRHIFEWIED